MVDGEVIDEDGGVAFVFLFVVNLFIAPVDIYKFD